MNKMSCFVPMCGSTILNDPQKLFVAVPRENAIRMKWFEMCQRLYMPMDSINVFFCCEDHFENLHKAFENYTQIRLLKGSGSCPKRVILTSGALPTKFDCQHRNVIKKLTLFPEKRKGNRELAVVMKECKVKAFEDVPFDDVRINIEHSYCQSSAPDKISEILVKTDTLEDVTCYDVKNNIEDIKSHGHSPVEDKICEVSMKAETFENVPFDDIAINIEHSYCQSSALDKTSDILRKTDDLDVNMTCDDVKNNIENMTSYGDSSVLGKISEISVKAESLDDVPFDGITNNIEDLHSHCHSPATDKITEIWIKTETFDDVPFGGITNNIEDINSYFHSPGPEKISETSVHSMKSLILQKVNEEECIEGIDRYKTSNDGEDLLSSGQHSEIELFSCNACKYKTGSKNTLKYHMLTHMKKKRSTCHLCNYSTKSNTNLKRHILLHLDETRYFCYWCNFSTPRKTNLKRHIFQRHSKPFSCKLCKYGTNKLSELKCHMSSRHSEKVTSSCNLCKYKGITNIQLKYHMLKYSKEMRFYCDLCNVSTKSKGYLKRHIFRKHSEQEPFSLCNLCKCRKITNMALKSRMSTHSDEKLFSCNVCKYITSSCWDWKSHMSTHSEKKLFSCDLCNFSTKKNVYLNRHIVRKHSDKEPFSCNVCNYMASSCWDLKSHMPTHFVKKPLSCDWCNFSTNRNYNLTRHIFQKHSEEDRLFCHVCKYKASTNSDFKSHMLAHSEKSIVRKITYQYRTILPKI